MAKKRIIGSIFIKNNLAVQSYGYEKYRPLGNPIIVAENLARWKVDEILINFIDLTKENDSINFDLINKISKVASGTPIIYGGAIKNVDVAREAITSGADRVLVDNIFLNNFNEVKKISKFLGRQAMVFSLPFISEYNGNSTTFYHYNYLNKKRIEMSYFLKNYNFEDFSELILIDVMADGGLGLYNDKILNFFNDFDMHRLICMGGISSTVKLQKILSKEKCDGVAIGNSLNFIENNIFKIKSEIATQIDIRF